MDRAPRQRHLSRERLPGPASTTRVFNFDGSPTLDPVIVVLAIGY